MKGTGEKSPLQATTVGEWMDGRNILFLSTSILFRERTRVNDLRVSRVMGGGGGGSRTTAASPPLHFQQGPNQTGMTQVED